MAEFLTKRGLVPLKCETNVPGVFYIHGELCQVAHFVLQVDQKIQCEPGSMCYTSDGVKQSVKLGGIGRLITEGNIFKSLYHNQAKKEGYVGVTADFPATLIPLNLDNMQGQIVCKHDAFLAAIDPNCKVSGTTLNSATCMGCCCSGMDIIMQKVSAKGWVFLAAHGTIMTKVLAANEEIIVDTHAVVACSHTVKVDVRRTGGCSVICCGGEGMFNTALKGPGQVILCSMPMEKLRALFPRPAPRGAKVEDPTKA